MFESSKTAKDNPCWTKKKRALTSSRGGSDLIESLTGLELHFGRCGCVYVRVLLGGGDGRAVGRSDGVVTVSADVAHLLDLIEVSSTEPKI